MIRFCLRLLLLLALLGGTGTAVRAQRHFLKHFGPAEGFAPSFVYALHQDRQGYLWVATAEGLVRYDGTEFVTFTTKQGLAEDFATKLYEDTTTHTLWVNHYQGGVSRWDGQRFQKVGKAAKLPGGFQSRTGVPVVDTAAIREYRQYFGLSVNEVPDITGIIEDQEGNAWLGTAGQGLWRHSDRHLRLRPGSDVPHQPLTAMSRQDFWLLGGADGTVFFAVPPSFSPNAAVFGIDPGFAQCCYSTGLPSGGFTQAPIRCMGWHDSYWRLARRLWQPPAAPTPTRYSARNGASLAARRQQPVGGYRR